MDVFNIPIYNLVATYAINTPIYTVPTATIVVQNTLVDNTLGNYSVESANIICQQSEPVDHQINIVDGQLHENSDEFQINEDSNNIDDQVSDDESIINDVDSATYKRTIKRNRYSQEEYKCTMCPYKCTTEKAFLKHLKKCSTKENEGSSAITMLSCKICGKDRVDKKSMAQHMLKHKDHNHYCCDFCKFKSCTLKKVVQHRRAHTGERPHQCPICLLRSSRRDNLHAHAKRVHNIDNITEDTFSPRNMIIIPSVTKKTSKEEP